MYQMSKLPPHCHVCCATRNVSEMFSFQLWFNTAVAWFGRYSTVNVRGRRRNHAEQPSRATEQSSASRRGRLEVLLAGSGGRRLRYAGCGWLSRRCHRQGFSLHLSRPSREDDSTTVS
ncbi:hypothetical protein N657DRAFT_368362 [Parathielavia appendiculata]|uniref:Uncharacterized protein n=1 Tax=Parathielavia appendiculata TaxID=2587402 RepID=A0AAN6TQ38_9PEZI|nr:hypothetical protein N657DRAFT_368362 [Parathielavia appendiculata]